LTPDAVAKTVAELTSQQDGVVRQQVIEQLMRRIMHYDGEANFPKGGLCLLESPRPL